MKCIIILIQNPFFHIKRLRSDIKNVYLLSKTFFIRKYAPKINKMNIQAA